MENETDVTRAQMDETRASLSQKLETLEKHVVDTVHGAADMMGQTVDNVKEAVHETVENVKETFDLPLQVTRHPWAMVGGSIALGYLGGYLLYRLGTAQPRANGWSQPAAPASPRIIDKPNGVAKEPRFQEEAPATKPVQNAAPAAAAEPGWLDGVQHRFEAEIHKVTELAIGTALGVVRDMITQSAPDVMKAGLTDVIDGITVKLGGEPIHGPVLNDGACPAPAPRQG
jgi:ElaB/YqjD/DUF883 family membrane-anchored ribosome-binding protein